MIARMQIDDFEATGPLWQRIERTLLSEIGTSAFAPGSQLPNELELAKRFAVNRHTVRRAMAALAQRGAIRIEQGRGSFVQDNLIHYAVGAKTRVEENLTRQHRGFSGRPPPGRFRNAGDPRNRTRPVAGNRRSR